MPRFATLRSATLTAALVVALPRAAGAQDLPVSPAQMKADARAYYDAEMKAAFLFVGFGALQAGGGGVALSRTDDFAKAFGWSSVALGGVTALGGAGYAIAVKIRGDYYTGLAETDLARFQREESEHLTGTHGRYVLYLATELVETAAGIGLSTYGLAAKDDVTKGIGISAAINGFALFVMDVPGAGRASAYLDELRRFHPSVAPVTGARGDHGFALTLARRF